MEAHAPHAHAREGQLAGLTGRSTGNTVLARFFGLLAQWTPGDTTLESPEKDTAKPTSDSSEPFSLADYIIEPDYTPPPEGVLVLNSVDKPIEEELKRLEAVLKQQKAPE